MLYSTGAHIIMIRYCGRTPHVYRIFPLVASTRRIAPGIHAHALAIRMRMMFVRVLKYEMIPEFGGWPPHCSDIHFVFLIRGKRFWWGVQNIDYPPFSNFISLLVMADRGSLACPFVFQHLCTWNSSTGAQRVQVEGASHSTAVPPRTKFLEHARVKEKEFLVWTSSTSKNCWSGESRPCRC